MESISCEGIKGWYLYSRDNYRVFNKPSVESLNNIAWHVSKKNLLLGKKRLKREEI